MIVNSEGGKVYIWDEPISKIESWSMVSTDMEMIDALPLCVSVSGTFTGTYNSDKEAFRKFRKGCRNQAKQHNDGWVPVEMRDGAHTFVKGMSKFTLWARIKLRLGLGGKLKMKFRREADR